MFYSSSSSVYGDSKIFPLRENAILKPKIFMETKIKNEKEANKFAKTFGKKLIGLRFFTVYGEWGRPDMLIIKMLNSMVQKYFELNNSGDHYRDFTYINDVVRILVKLISVKKFNYKVYNICSSRPIFIKKSSS